MERLNKIFKLNDEKSKTVFKNIFFSFFIKGVNIGISFLTIPLVLSFLSTTQYGIWLTLTAILGWFSFFDLGFGNGLRNHLTTAISSKKFEEGRLYISTTYAALSCIFGFLLILFLLINPFITWTSVFNAPSSMSSDLSGAVLYAISFLFVQFVLRLITTVLLSLQKSAAADLTGAIIQILTFIGLIILKYYHYNTLKAVALIYSIIPVVVFLGANLLLFNRNYVHLRPSFSHVKFKHARGLLNIGLSFFVIQIAALVIYASDNFIISQLFKPADVTTYNVAFKYFSIGSIFFTIVLTPFWSMTTKAFAENDWTWIKNIMKKLYFFWFFLVIVIVLQLFVANWVYKLWTHANVVVPIQLSVIMCIYYMFVTLGSIFSNFLNGVGKVKLQLYFASASMVLNVPLAIVFIKVFKFGIVGIPLATIIVTALTTIISFVQYNKIINGQARGIWDK